MQALLNRETLLERRMEAVKNINLWEDLTLAQKFSASSLLQFGYELFFIRDKENKSTAILLCNGMPATINSEGEINTSPKITIRV